MAAGAAFGFVIAFAMFALTRILPEPIGWAIFWAFTAGLLSLGAVVVWRRTRLLLTTASLGFGAIFSLAIVMTIVATGAGWPDLLFAYWIVIVPCLLEGPVLLFLESRRHPVEWKRWRDHAESCSLADTLAFRHIPDWRQ